MIAATGLVGIADSAMTAQHRILEGCWPTKVYFNNDAVLTVNFWLDYVESRDLNPIAGFFFTRVRHRILFYIMVLCAIIGWSGSIFLRIVTSEDTEGTKREVPSWESFVASFFLSALGGAILFLLLVSLRLAVDPSGKACISEGYSFLAAVGGIACGLFVVRFYRWFEEQSKAIWGSIFRKPGT